MLSSHLKHSVRVEVVPRIVAGGTGSFPIYASLEDPALELSPGTCAFHDVGYGEMFPDLGIGPQVLLCRMAEVSAADALRCATGLRQAGVRVEVYADAAPMKKQLGYANAIGVDHVAILGPQEVSQGVVSLKDLRTGEQVSCAPSRVAEHLEP